MTSDGQAPPGQAARAIYDFLWPIYRDGAWGRGDEIRSKFLAASDVNAVRREAVEQYRVAPNPDPLTVLEDDRFEAPPPRPTVPAGWLLVVAILAAVAGVIVGRLIS